MTHSPFLMRNSACLYFRVLVSPVAIFLMVTFSFRPIFDFSRTMVSMVCRCEGLTPAPTERAFCANSSVLRTSSFDVLSFCWERSLLAS